MRLKTWTKEQVRDCCNSFSISTTGDIGKYSETYLEITDGGGTIWDISYKEDSKGFGTLKIKLTGGAELHNFSEGLRFFADAIEMECMRRTAEDKIMLCDKALENMCKCNIEEDVPKQDHD